jgi:hypothetical protein
MKTNILVGNGNRVIPVFLVFVVAAAAVVTFLLVCVRWHHTLAHKAG